MQETLVLSLCQKDTLEKEMGTHSSILAWEIPWTEETGRLQSVGSQSIRHDWAEAHTRERYGKLLINKFKWEIWFFQIVVLEKIPEILIDCKEIKPINPKGNHPWIFTGRTDAKADASILWPPAERSWLIGKDLDAGKDWGQGEKGAIGDEMVGWHHWLIGHEFEQTLGDREGQGILTCCIPWGCRELNPT